MNDQTQIDTRPAPANGACDNASCGCGPQCQCGDACVCTPTSNCAD
ncbi:hypothetical protein ACN2C6_17310 [Caulobacter sp. ErkDOM-YI]